MHIDRWFCAGRAAIPATATRLTPIRTALVIIFSTRYDTRGSRALQKFVLFFEGCQHPRQHSRGTFMHFFLSSVIWKKIVGINSKNQQMRIRDGWTYENRLPQGSDFLVKICLVTLQPRAKPAIPLCFHSYKAFCHASSTQRSHP